MKVLHLLSSTGYHGAENMVTQLVKALTVHGIQNSIGVFFGHGNANKQVLKAARKYIHDGVIFPCHKRLDISAILALRRYILDNEIQIIHSHKYKTNLHSFFAAMGTPVRLVSTCHNWLGSSLKMKFYASLDKQVLKAFDATIGVSTEVESELLRRLPKKKVRRIENGIDLERFTLETYSKAEAKQAVGLSKESVIIGYVGRVSEEKGILFLLKAVRLLISDYENIFCLIVGDGEYANQLKESAKQLGIDDRTIFTGRRSDTPLLYAAMDIFVLPSLEEAFPMVILEAMACGVPVVATEVGDIPLIIEHGVSGLLVKRGSAEMLEKALASMIRERGNTEKMGLEGHKVVQKHFSSSSMAKRYIEVYKAVLKRR